MRCFWLWPRYSPEPNTASMPNATILGPLGMFVLYSPKGTYDPLFLSNYAYVNLNDPLTRVPGVRQAQAPRNPSSHPAPA